MKRDQITGCIGLIMGILVAVATYLLPDSSMSSDIGPKFFPAICAVGLIVPGIGLLLKKSDGPVSKLTFGKRESKRLALISLLVIAYVVAMDFIGFIIPTIIVQFVMCNMFAKGVNVSLVSKILFAVVVTILIYLAFENLMSLQLPRGRLF